MTGTQGGTELMAQPIGLRIKQQDENNAAQVVDGTDDHHAHDVALEDAEERLIMGEDEEIDSVDGLGNPVADLVKLEKRNLTVALARSVAETSPAAAAAATTTTTTTGEGGGGCEPMGDDSSSGGKRYGLRARRFKEKDLAVAPLSRMVSTDDAALVRPRPRPTADAQASALASAVPLIRAPVSAAPPIATTTIAAAATTGPPKVTLVKPFPLQTIAAPVPKSSHGVPNPLAHMATTGAKKVPPNVAQRPTFHPNVPCPLPSVPCPLPAPMSAAAIKVEQMPARMPDTTTQLNDGSGATTRGRIFSIDIDPEGLEFTDMPVENLAADFSQSPNLRPMPAPGKQAPIPSNAPSVHLNNPHQQVSYAPSTKMPVPMPVSSAAAGRGRAMSFEFFSLGINPDEAPPPAPEAALSSSMPMMQPMRPRGDSIIFDPISFQEGGILEEKALMKNRANSMDLPSQDEMAILNAPGFVAPPLVAKAIQPKPVFSSFNHKPDAAQMATLPSSLNTSINTSNHATFQMDLLNKGGRIGIYLPDARRARIAKFHSKRKMRIWRKRIKYDCRKKLADSRPRIKGRFVKRSDMDED